MIFSLKNHPAENPALLLVVTGTLVGFNCPLGKIAGDAGIPPVVWAMLVSLGASGLLLPLLMFKRQLSLPKGKTLRYVIVSGLISFITPNLLLLSVIPHAGAGYTGLMFALSPVFTLILALVLGQQGPGGLGLIGIALGLVGALVVSYTRASTGDALSPVWLAAALLIPLVLACGNIYRSWDWPEGAQPETLAFWSHAFSLTFYVSFLGVSKLEMPMEALMEIPQATLAQMLVSGLTFPVFFRLQKKGGPVLLSQLGYVAAAVSLLTATLLLGERYRPATWFGALIIACGIMVTLFPQRKKSGRLPKLAQGYRI